MTRTAALEPRANPEHAERADPGDGSRSQWPQLDGLRGLAVLSVFAGTCSHTWAKSYLVLMSVFVSSS